MITSDRSMWIGEFEVDLVTQNASSYEGKLNLSEKEIKLLELFQQQRGETLRIVDNPDEVRGLDADPTPGSIDNYIVKFRKIFKKNSENPVHFINVKNVGYRFVS